MECCPLWHVSHSELPAIGANFPKLHAGHLEAAIDLYPSGVEFPAGHWLQCSAPSSENRPDEHVAHLELPDGVSTAFVPLGHSVQPEAPAGVRWYTRYPWAVPIVGATHDEE